MASRRWLAVIVVLFCLPLFVGLRNRDLENDEAIYSFAVDRILEIGDWLQPKSSPSETVVFLEKPPLKFWIVAAPIKAGMLPHDEFGMRFWDALFGAIAFVYVFGIGQILAGPVCGLVAVLILVVHPPLLFDHGIRGNNMEASLLLSYCGGIYHFLRWTAATSRRTPHAVGVGLYFVLGFMTKFVAVVFLPAVLLLPALVFRQPRARLTTGWITWARVAGLIVLLIAPWFVYAHLTFGGELWHVMLAEHVYARFTTGLTAEHIQPWHFYFSTMWGWFVATRVEWLVALGAVTLIAQAIRRRWFEATVVVAWGLLTLVPISFGSSKLYHYAYPFLPPVALAAGYLVALVMMLAPTQVRKLGWLLEDLLARSPRLAAAGTHKVVRGASALVVWSAAALAIATLLLGRVRMSIGDDVWLRNTSVLRPVALMLIAAVAVRSSARVATLATAIVVAMVLPLSAYQTLWKDLAVVKHPMRDASECVERVQKRSGLRPGIGVDTTGLMHPIYYYFRRVRPMTFEVPISDATLNRALYEPQQSWPVLVKDARYRQYLDSGRAAAEGPSPPVATFYDYVLALPGPYRVCSSEAATLSLAPSGR